MGLQFKYRFESVLTLRRNDEEKIKREMAPYIARYNQLQSDINKLTENLALFNARKMTFLRSPDRLSYYTESVKYYRQAIIDSEIRRRKLDSEFDEVKQKLREAVMRRKSLEIIKEKDYQKYRRENMKKEQIVMEEAAIASKLQMKF